MFFKLVVLLFSTGEMLRDPVAGRGVFGKYSKRVFNQARNVAHNSQGEWDTGKAAQELR
ncbi:hypothetical protein N9Z64_01830 [bacterium]|nr:hypothetical protein [bacterium]